MDSSLLGYGSYHGRTDGRTTNLTFGMPLHRFFLREHAYVSFSGVPKLFYLSNKTPTSRVCSDWLFQGKRVLTPTHLEM